MKPRRASTRARTRRSARTGWSRELLLTFLWPTVIWLISAGSLVVGLESSKGLKVFLSVAFLGIFDFFALGKTVAFLSALVSSRGTVQKAGFIRGSVLWGSLKLSALFALLGVTIWGRELPRWGLVLGYFTLIVIPIAGGFLWSGRKQNFD